MFERIRDWLAVRGRRGHDRAFPTSPAEPELTPEEEAEARKQLYGDARVPADEPREDS